MGLATSVEVAASSPLALAKFCKIIKARKVEGEDVEIFEGNPEPFDLWPHQKELLHLAVRRRRVICLKARQLGVTWTWALLALWYAWTHPGAQVLIVSIGEREAQSVIRRIKFLFDSLPRAVQQSIGWGTPNGVPRHTSEQFEIRHPEGNSLIFSLPSSASAGRGETANLLILDEGAHWEDASNRVASLMPTQADIGQVVVSSTANGIGGYYFDLWEQGEELKWDKLFVGALGRPDRTEEQVDLLRAQLDLRGIDQGKSNLGAQEYPYTPLEAFISTGHCIFNADDLSLYMENSVRDSQWRGTLISDASGVKTLEMQGGWWRVWGWRQPERRYVIAGDPCGGPGSVDSAAMVVADTQSADQLAAFHGKPDPEEFARQMYRAGYLYQDDRGTPALLVPEANGIGHAVLALLKEWQYPNVWANRRFDQKRQNDNVQHGWLTTSATRPIMIAALQEGLRLGTLGVRDKSAIGEFQRFIANPAKGGRPEAMEGYHDDRTMTWAMIATVVQRELAGVKQTPTKPESYAPYRSPSSNYTGY
jgi:hypothetical protein